MSFPKNKERALWHGRRFYSFWLSDGHTSVSTPNSFQIVLAAAKQSQAREGLLAVNFCSPVNGQAVTANTRTLSDLAGLCTHT